MSSQDLFSSNRFKLQLSQSVGESGIFEYNVTNFELPGLAMGISEYPTPARSLWVPGDNIELDDLSITFLVDKQLKSWRSIYNWIVSMRSLDTAGVNPIYRNANLIVLDAEFVPMFGIDFTNVFPYTLSGIEFSTTIEQVDTMTATATFKINGIDFKEI